MFITDTAFRSPVSDLFGDASVTYWHATELALHHSWFLVTVRQVESDDDAFVVGRTMMLSRASDVEDLIQQNSAGLLRFESVQVITPAHVNGSEHWKMDPLLAVWVADEPSFPGQIAEVYETSEGVKYVISMLGTPIDQLRHQALRFRAPVQKSR